MNNIISFIKKSQLKLNMIILVSWLLKLLFLSGLIAGFIIFISRLFKIYNTNIDIWIISTLIGGFTGIIIGLNKRINLITATKWLDDYYENNDILSSALLCIEKKCIGVFDKIIIEKANKILLKNRKIKWPFKDIRKRLILCIISSLLCASVFLFWNPIYKNKKINNLSLKTNIENDNEQIQNNKKSFFKKEQTPKDLARFLFPENQKLTELAENAIEKGDMDTLNEIFQKEISKFDELIKNAENQAEKNKLKEKQEQKEKIMQLLKDKDKDEKNKNNEREKRSTMKYKDEENKKQIDDNKKTNEKLDENNPQSTRHNNLVNGETQEKGDDLVSGIKQSDTGVNNEKKDREEITPDNNNEKLLLTQKKDSPEFIFLLPDKKTYIPLNEMIINSQRSAESAVSRKGIPVEYEDFVRSYFMSLLEEMKKNKSNQKEEK